MLNNFFLAIFETYHSRALGVPLGLLLHRSKVRSYSKPPVLSSEPPKLSIKTIFEHD